MERVDCVRDNVTLGEPGAVLSVVHVNEFKDSEQIDALFTGYRYQACLYWTRSSRWDPQIVVASFQWIIGVVCSIQWTACQGKSIFKLMWLATNPLTPRYRYCSYIGGSSSHTHRP